MDNDALIGQVDFFELLNEFETRKEIAMQPSWCNFMGGPFICLKREGVSRWMHQRQTANIRDPDEPKCETLLEREWEYIFRGGRWWNPWPQFNNFYPSANNPMAPVEENWPFVYHPEEPFLTRYLNEKCPLALPRYKTGQILPNSPFGIVLTDLARKSQTIVETGTWYGEGSTRCIAMGLHNPNQKFITIERDPRVSRMAASRYSDSRITFLAGSFVPIFGNPQIPVLENQVPPQIDLLLIDSGECEGRSEMLLLESRSKIIAMDDTNCDKNRENREDLIKRGWKVLFDCPNDRNGWAVFERPK
jgi:hypothetical protein